MWVSFNIPAIPLISPENQTFWAADDEVKDKLWNIEYNVAMDECLNYLSTSSGVYPVSF